MIFEDGRAVGTRAQVSDGWERELFARIVVDGSGRACLLADQLGLKGNDPSPDLLCLSAWFEGVNEPPASHDGFTLAYPLGPSHGLAWQTPLRRGRTSMGVVVGEETPSIGEGSRGVLLLARPAERDVHGRVEGCHAGAALPGRRGSVVHDRSVRRAGVDGRR